MIKRDFNTAAKFFLGLSMFAIAMTIINSFMTISINSKLGFNIDKYVVEIIFDVIILIAAVFTFKRKRYGLILLVALFITRIFATIPWGNDAPTAYLLGGKIAILVRDFGLFAIAMCFRKNGISGWVSMLASEEFLARSLQKDKDETSSILYDDNINIDKTETTSRVRENDTAAQENEYPSYHEKKQDNNNKNHSRKLNAKTKIVFISSIILILGLISCALIISFKSYPEYISSFGDKWKHTFNIPNNALSNKLFEEAINSRHNSCFFFVNGEAQFHQNHRLFYNNPEKYIEKYRYADVYMMLDTVKSKSDIINNANYAVGFLDNFGYDFATSTMCLDNYDKWIHKNPNVVIVRLEEFNMQEAYEKECKLVSYSAEIPVNDINIVKKIANYYEAKDNYNKSADIYKFALEYNKDNPVLLGSLSLAQYYNSDFELSRENAKKALDFDSKEVISLQVLSQLEADEFNWGEAKKYAKKAIDYGCENAEPYFVYAQSIYKQGEKEVAREYYNKAYNLNSKSSLAKKYKECGGCPFDIISMDFAFTKNNGEIITNYGEKLYSSKSQYISPKARLRVLRGETCTVQCKLYSRGELSTGEDSSNGYTYEKELFFFIPGQFEEKLGGWGNSTPGNWRSGNYRFEVWYNGEKIGEERFTLY